MIFYVVYMGNMVSTRSLSLSELPSNDLSAPGTIIASSQTACAQSSVQKRSLQQDDTGGVAKRQRHDSDGAASKRTYIEEVVYQRGGDLIIELDRLYARIRTEELLDECTLHIRPSPAKDGSKTVTLETKLGLASQSWNKEPLYAPPAFELAQVPTSHSEISDHVDTASSECTRRLEPDEGASGCMNPQVTVELQTPNPNDNEPKPDNNAESVDERPAEIDRESFPPIPRDSSPYFGEPREPLGFYEVGCLSYRSVVIQALAHSSAVRRYLDNLTTRRACYPGFGPKFRGSVTEKCKPGLVSCYLRNVICSIWNENNRKPTAAEYNAFNDALQSDYRQREAKGELEEDPFDWKSGNQNPTDAGTALQWIAMLLRKEEENRCEREEGQANEWSCKPPPFSFAVKEQEHCGECDNTTTGTTQHDVLVLEKPHNSGMLSECITDKLASQPASKATCLECGNRTRVEVESSISGPEPEVLFVQLNSLDSLSPERHASADEVIYGATLKPTLQSRITNQNPNYNLMAVICHDGQDPTDAHWVLHARSPLGIYFIDDDWVSESSLHSMLNPSTFTPKDEKRRAGDGKIWRPLILMYERAGAQPIMGESSESLGSHSSKSAHGNDVTASLLRRSRRKPKHKPATVPND